MQPRARGNSCPICDGPLVPELDEGWRLTRGASPRDWFQSHCQSNHQDYLAWKKSKKRLATILGTATAIGMAFLVAVSLYFLGIVLPNYPSPAARPAGWLFLLPALVGFFLPGFLISRWGTRKFSREWKQRGGVPAASFDQSS